MSNPTTTPTYPGTVRSALTRTRRELKAAGFSLGKIVGRYPNQHVVSGWNAKQVGCSNTIRVIYWNDSPGDVHDTPATVVPMLRARGLPFDDSGWMKCTGTDL
ncbi:MAG TPA: hypothetical protein VFB71_12285 [Ramlibacter sp.]|nr:hypothetical protein [Ramlibacter sp.]